MDSRGNPAQCFTRRKRSSSTAVTSSPSRSRTADTSPWYALIPRMIICLGPLGGHKVHKMVKFRPRGMVDKREMEQTQLFETADERGCTPMFGAAHRRGSACIGGSLPLRASHFTAHVHACARLSSSILISTRRRNQRPCRKCKRTPCRRGNRGGGNTGRTSKETASRIEGTRHKVRSLATCAFQSDCQRIKNTCYSNWIW